MKKINLDDLGEPNISFSGLKVWILGREFPESSDYWDGNWLDVIVLCESMWAQVWVQGPIIHLSELRQWLGGLKELHETVQGEAELPCMESELRVKVVMNKLGNGSLIVNITPDQMKERHEFILDIDQSFLPEVIKNLESILDRYPIKSPR